ncbi:MAG: hypothetical protein V3R78_14900 [Thermodesulfobacteriota bacterium]
MSITSSCKAWGLRNKQPPLLILDRDTALESTVKISKEDFVDTLYLWLSEHLTEKEVKAMADEVGFNTKGLFRIKVSKKLYSKLYIELFTLNMYLIVSSCEAVIEDEDKKKNVLDMFYNTVFEKNIKVSGISYNKWLNLMELIYDEYGKATEEASLLSPLLLLANRFCKNLFGDKMKLDSSLKFEISMRIGGMAKQLSKTLHEYDID